MDEKLMLKKSRKNVAFQCEVDLLKRLDDHAEKIGVTRTRFLEFAIKNTLDEIDAKPKAKR